MNCMFQQVASPLQDAADRIRGPLLGHEEVLICRGVQQCPLNADGDIQWAVISRMLLPHRYALDQDTTCRGSVVHA